MLAFLLFATLVLKVATEETFIIGGNDVTEAGKWPWQGSLIIDRGHVCGISMLASRWGLTAAHCVHGKEASSINLRFGTNSRIKGGALILAKRIIMHEDYNCRGSSCIGGKFPNDIALVEFKTGISGVGVSPIPLAPKGSEHAGNEDCWITGWGYTKFGEPLPVTLQEAKINVYTNNACREWWMSDRINAGHVCGGEMQNQRTSCNGDSGGPLVCKVNGRYELVGATSWGPAGCRVDVPAVYTRIAYYRDWIKVNSGI